MRPLSLVPMRTVPGCKPGVMEKAVIVGELQTTSVAPSGKMRNTALLAVETSDRLRLGAGVFVTGAPVSSMAVIVTDVVGVAVSVGVGAATGVDGARAVAAASLSAKA